MKIALSESRSLVSRDDAAMENKMKIKLLGVLGAGLLLGSLTAHAVPLQWATNGHYYEFVPFAGTNLTWEQANTAANSSSYLGMTGYLATITSQAEQDFVYSLLGSNVGGWLGGKQDAGAAEPGGGWRWVGGPESGQLFWNSGSTGMYANWFGGEPNNNPCCGGPENYLSLTSRESYGGKWNDLSLPDPTINTNSLWWGINGYFVEYSVPEPGSLALLGLGLMGLGLSRRRKAA